ncbi:MAG: hypothetical protein IPM69_12020 [Ignavibacteria bacterium]|nr:hypothetical protein [Ignavibacteria bacterium]
MPFPENYFDVNICGDVLEHLIDPWETLKNLLFTLDRWSGDCEHSEYRLLGCSEVDYAR